MLSETFTASRVGFDLRLRPSLISVTVDAVEPDVLATHIRMIMGARKMTRKYLAEEMGISRPSLSNKVDGKVPFTYNELIRLIRVLDVTWDALMSGPYPD